MRAAAAIVLAVSSVTLASEDPALDQREHERLAEPFDAVGQLSGMGTGTLIAEDWVLTAAHVADFFRMRRVSPIEFEINGKTYAVEEVVVHPDWTPLEQQMAAVRGGAKYTPGDVALLRLAEPVDGIEPMPLGEYDDDEEITLVGVGAFIADAANGLNPRQAMGLPRGIKHAGTNTVDRVDTSRNELVISFSAPDDPTATDHEIGAYVGDSGGPVLAKQRGTWRLIGVMGAVETTDDKMGNYGDEVMATSVGEIAAWIEQTIID
ncbi:MAG: trypsin-like serine protease [Planctomycetota bacterium]